MEKNFYLGAHASMSKGFENALKYISSIGGNSAQVFLKSPRGGGSKPLDEIDAKKTNDYLVQNGMFLVGHCSYLLNFANDPDENPKAVESLIDDMVKMGKLGGAGVVLHIGKYKEMTKEEAFENIKRSVSKVLENTPENTKVIFENTAGQGTEIGYRFEELGEIYNLFDDKQKERIGFCLDTCHSFVAGYDLRTKEGVDNWKNEFDKNIGWDKVVCIHFNDAKKDFGTRVDRHDDLGFGFIGNDGLKEVAKIAYETSKPLILETLEEKTSYKEQLDMMKSWI